MAGSSRSRFALLVGCGLVVALASKGQALQAGYAMDDFTAAGSPISQILPSLLENGRFAQAGLLALLDAFGLTVAQASFPSVAAMLAALSLFVVVSLEYGTRGRVPLPLQIALVCFVCAHPYWAEYFSFRISMPGLAAAVTLAGVALIAMGSAEGATSRSRSRLLYLLATVSLAVSAGQLQQPFLMVVAAVLARFAVDCSVRSDKWMRFAIERNWRGFGVIASAAACYAILAWLSLRAFGLRAGSRTSVVAPGEVAQRLTDVKNLLFNVVLGSDPLLSSAPRYLIAGTWALLVLVATARHWRNGLILLALAPALLLLSVAPVVLSADWWPVPRTLIGWTLASALSIAVAAVLADGWARTSALAVGIAALIAGLSSAAVLFDQVRINRWDMFEAQAISLRIAEKGLLDGADRVVLVGASYRFPTALDTTVGDLNISSLFVPGAVDGLFQEATGQDWTVAVGDPGDYACDAEDVWPAAGSVRVEGDEVVVCMSASQ